jgi:hypothetical protein
MPRTSPPSKPRVRVVLTIADGSVKSLREKQKNLRKKIQERKHRKEILQLKIARGKVMEKIEGEMRRERMGLVKGRYEVQKDLREYIQRLHAVFEAIKQGNIGITSAASHE